MISDTACCTDEALLWCALAGGVYIAGVMNWGGRTRNGGCAGMGVMHGRGGALAGGLYIARGCTGRGGCTGRPGVHGRGVH